MKQPHLTIAHPVTTVLHGAPAPTTVAGPQPATDAYPDPAAGALMRVACTIDAWPGPEEGKLEGEASEDGIDAFALGPLAIAALGHTPSGLEMWMPLSRNRDSLDLLGESGVMLVGVNELGWVVYDWIPGP